MALRNCILFWFLCMSSHRNVFISAQNRCLNSQLTTTIEWLRFLQSFRRQKNQNKLSLILFAIVLRCPCTATNFVESFSTSANRMAKKGQPKKEHHLSRAQVNWPKKIYWNLAKCAQRCACNTGDRWMRISQLFVIFLFFVFFFADLAIVRNVIVFYCLPPWYITVDDHVEDTVAYAES